MRNKTQDGRSSALALRRLFCVCSPVRMLQCPPKHSHAGDTPLRLSQEYPPLRMSVLGNQQAGVSTNTPSTRRKSQAVMPIVKGVPPLGLIITILVALDQTALSELKE